MMFKYNKGDAVWMLNEERKIGVTQKLQKPYKGPYVVTKKFNDLDYRIQMDAKGSSRVLHYNKLKPYNSEINDSWLKRVQKKLGNN